MKKQFLLFILLFCCFSCASQKREIIAKSTIRYYLGDCYEKDVHSGGNIEERLYIGGNPCTADIVCRRTISPDTDNDSRWRFNLIHRDHLGSISLVTDVEGNKIAEYSYDAWGRLRDPYTGLPYAPDQSPPLLLKRGFTGHEHLPEFGSYRLSSIDNNWWFYVLIAK